MGYFLPSFFQKRVLRYALSRLDILDTDALDLDCLDISWGKRSTIELRDVRIKLKVCGKRQARRNFLDQYADCLFQRLATLLQVPDYLSFTHARITLLRLTIPADIYSSGIVIEVEGVSVKADFAQSDSGADDTNTKRKNNGRGELSKGVKANRPRNTPPRKHDPGGLYEAHSGDEIGDDSYGALPTTEDLAQSFVDTKSLGEKAELKAALAKSQKVREDQIFDHEEESSEEGLGVGLSLPGFVADFLKGVENRLKVSISSVQIDLTLRLDTASISPSAGYGNGSESLSLRLRVGAVSIKETSVENDGDTSSLQQHQDSAIMSAIVGSRRVSITDIKGMLVSDPSLFTMLSQYSGPSSPAATYSGAFSKGNNKTSQPTAASKSSSLSSSPVLATSTVFESFRGSPAYSRPSDSIATSTGNHFFDTNARAQLHDPSQAPNYSYDPRDSRYEDIDDNHYSFPKRNALQNSIHDDNDDDYKDDDEESEGLTMSDFLEQKPQEQGRRPSRHEIQDAITRRSESKNRYKSVPDAMSSRSGRSKILEGFRPNPQSPQYQDRTYSRFGSRPTSRPSSRSHSISSSPSEDLTQSKMFSHDEAESMYMSATSHVGSMSQHESVLASSKAAEPVDQSSPNELAESSFHSYQEPMAHFLVSEDLERTQLGQKATKSSTAPLFPHSSSPSQRNRNTDTDSESISPVTAPSYGHITLAESLKTAYDSEGSPDTQRSSSVSSKSAPVIAKNFFTIDSLEITIPQDEIPFQQLVQGEGSLEPRRKSDAQSSLPGAFSIYESSAVSDSRQEAADSTKRYLPNSKVESNKSVSKERPISIHSHDMTLFMDIGFLRLMILVMQQVPDMAHTSKKPSAPLERKPAIPPKTAQSHKIQIDEFSLKFVDVLGSYVDDDIRHSTDTSSLLPPSVPDVLLELNTQAISISQDNAGYSSRTEFTIGRFTFGYPDDPIISFSPAIKIRESIRDTLSLAGQDVKLKLSQVSSSPLEVNVETLPLQITLDLTRLDDTFAWFGGLSTVLGLGSSMMSTVTITEPKSRAPNVPKSHKSVRFSTPGQVVPEPVDEPTMQAKVNTRIGGFCFDLLGKESSLRIEGTAIRIVNRPSLIGLGIDRLRFRGPVLRTNTKSSPIDAQIGPIRVEYIQVPKEPDLERLLALLSLPQNGSTQDPDILIDTLLRQRRSGSLLRINIEAIRGKISPLQDLERFQLLSEELKKLSTVAKYLPEDDRPGVLVLALVQDLRLELDTGSSLGSVAVNLRNLDAGFVTFPSLFLLSIDYFEIEHQDDVIVTEVVPQRIHKKERRGSDRSPTKQHTPMVMARLIGDEMEPTLKIKLHNFCIEYHVKTIMAALGIDETTTGNIIVDNLATSVATLTPLPGPPKLSSQSSSQSHRSATFRSLALNIAMTDSAIGLNPRGSLAKGLIVLTDTRLNGTFSSDKTSSPSITLAIGKSSLMIIDNKTKLYINRVSSTQDVLLSISDKPTQLHTLSGMGYVSVSEISSAEIVVRMMSSKSGKSIDVEVKDNLLVLETCADSTQTLLAVFNGLSPPMPPSKLDKYKTEETVPIEDMIKSCIEDALVAAQEIEIGVDPTLEYDDEELTGDLMNDDIPQNLEFISSFYNPDPGSNQTSMENSMLESNVLPASHAVTREIGERRLPSSFDEQFEISPEKANLNFEYDHFETGLEVGGTAHRWNFVDNTYGRTQESKIKDSPFRLRVRDVHFIWNLFDGYDWQHTRDTISQVVSEVENKAAERLAAKRNKRRSLQEEDEDESVEACLFNSMYVTIPANHDPRDLAHQINHRLDDLSSEAESYATTTTMTAMSTSPSRQGLPKTKRRRLRLRRSKHHKMTFELKGVCADVIAFPPNSGETQSSIDIRVQDLEIFDHVPTSTWKKFATYMKDAGERQSETNMIHIEILNIKPVPDLAASEMSLKVTVLPLRLHVDQDALDFLTRFFEFKDETTTKKPSVSEEPFLSRVEINPIPVKLDFKPKRVDYAGLRSGHTTEFMNFFILDGAEMVLRRTILYGVIGFERLGKALNDVWMPDIKSNQLPTVLAGLAPVRSLVNVGSGVRDLVVIPMREYRKDGRLVRAVQKGAVSFAKTTTTELAKLGAKLAIGTQNVLQNAEDILAPSDPALNPTFPSSSGTTSDDEGEEERRTISPYADQPINVVQGLRGAYRHLGRDLLLAKDAIVAIPGEVRESGSATGAARALLRGAPTVVLRPALGVSKAVGQTLLGAANALDGGERRRVEDVSFDFSFIVSCCSSISLYGCGSPCLACIRYSLWRIHSTDALLQKYKRR